MFSYNVVCIVWSPSLNSYFRNPAYYFGIRLRHMTHISQNASGTWEFPSNQRKYLGARRNKFYLGHHGHQLLLIDSLSQGIEEEGLRQTSWDQFPLKGAWVSRNSMKHDQQYFLVQWPISRWCSFFNLYQLHPIHHQLSHPVAKTWDWTQFQQTV